MKQTQADLIIGKFGGLTPAAHALGKPVSTVQRWKESGHIHHKNWPDILLKAAELNVPLCREDFVAHLPDGTGVSNEECAA